MINLTNEEIATLFQGKDAWNTNEIKDKNIPSISLHDGPNGLRIEEGTELGFSTSKKANAFPVASCIANSFDTDLLYEYGSYLANECINENVNIILGPGINHKRSPLGGRNFEYFSEDSILTASLASNYINGLQDKGIGVSLKHYACNSCEMGRMVSNSIIDKRTLNEIYLRAFDLIIKNSKPWTIMNSYNLINGVYSCENKDLMDHAKDIGFDGIFISDWGGVNNTIDSFKAGLHLQMPGGNIKAKERIIEAFNNNEITDSIKEDYIIRFNTFINRTSKHKKIKYDENKQLSFIRKALEKSIVLLKNEDDILPLNKKDYIHVYGPYAINPRFTGAGSSNVNPIYKDNLIDNLNTNKINYKYSKNFELDDIKKDELAIVICALDDGKESEGFDRVNLDLQANQVRFIYELSKITNNIVVILQVGSPVALPFLDDIKGLIYTSFGGCMSGEALYNVLYGKVNPSGKLAETWPIKLEDTPSFNYFNKDVRYTEYRETILTGYRYYDYFNIPINFEFGFGLSYTKFKYSNYKVKTDKENIFVYVDITNIGDKKGEEIVEIYSSIPKSKIFREKKKLIGFSKVSLKPNETKTVLVKVPKSHLSYFDTKLDKYSIEDGIYQIMVGSSLNDIKYTKSIKITGNKYPYTSIKRDYFILDKTLKVNIKDYESIYEGKVDYNYKVLPFSQNTILKELKETKFGSKIYKLVIFVIRHIKTLGLNESTIDEAPIRQALWYSKANLNTIDALVNYLNKHSLFKLIKVIRTLNK